MDVNIFDDINIRIIG